MARRGDHATDAVSGAPDATGDGPFVDWFADDAWRSVRAPLGECTGLPPAAYTDQRFADIERRRVFGRAWVCIGLAAEVAHAGRLLARQVGERSVVVTRDGDGVLRGFLNSCRHRGTELADADCDVGSTIRCPYHRWGYALDGRLIATPRFDEVPTGGFDRVDWGLAPVRVDTWGCLLFACLDPATPSLTDWLGDLPDRMGGYRLDEWRVHEERTLQIDANWKLIAENYQEYYHLQWVHPELAKVSRVADHYRYQGPGMYCGQTTTPVSSDVRDDWLSLPAAPWLDDSDAVSGRFVSIFPNVLLSVLPNHVFVMRLDPDRAESHHRDLHVPHPTGRRAARGRVRADAHLLVRGERRGHRHRRTRPARPRQLAGGRPVGAAVRRAPAPLPRDARRLRHDRRHRHPRRPAGRRPGHHVGHRAEPGPAAHRAALTGADPLPLPGRRVVRRRSSSRSGRTWRPRPQRPG